MTVKDSYFKDSCIEAFYYDENGKKALIRFSFNNIVTVGCSFEEYKEALKQIEDLSF